MAQADGVVANGTGSAVRADINGQLAALFTNHSGSTEPSTTFAFQTWADTNTNTLKLRNSSNDGWVQLARLDGQFDAKTFNSNITLNAQSDLRFADSDSSNWVAFQAPATVASNVTWTLPSADGTADQALVTNGSGTLSWADSGGGDNITEGNTSAEVVDTGSDGHFKVVTEGTEALRVDPSRRLLVGTASNTSIGGAGNGHTVQIAHNNDGGVFGLSVRGTTGGGIANLTNGVTSAAATADTLIGRLGFSGYDGTDLANDFARIECYADAQASNNDAPGRLTFSTTADGAASPTERARITRAGDVGINTSSPNYKVDINGELGITEGQPVTWHDGSGNASGQIFATSADDLRFRTTSAGLERMRIDSSGRVNIGNTESSMESTADDLVLGTGSGSNGMTIYSGATSTGAIAFANGNSGTNRYQGILFYSHSAQELCGATNDGSTRWRTGSTGFYPNADNNIPIGKSGNRWSAVWAANGTIQTSDQREKTEIADSALGTDFIKALRPVSYKWIEGGKIGVEGERDTYESVPGTRTHWGFIAQEVKQAADTASVDFGGWVLTDKDDPDSQQALRYDQFIAPLTKALQEAIAKIETLEAKVAALEAA